MYAITNTKGMMQPRHEVLGEAERLRAEIDKSNNELRALEQYANTMNSSLAQAELNFDNKFRKSASHCHKPNHSAGGRTIIETLQKEADLLKLTAESFRLQFDSEKRAREALRLKYDDLELSLATLQQERKIHQRSLSKSDKALLNAREDMLHLQQTVERTQAENFAISANKLDSQSSVAELETQVMRERERRQQVERQLEVITTNYSKLQKYGYDRVEELTKEISRIRTEYENEYDQNRRAQEDIILFSLRHKEEVKQVKTLLEEAREARGYEHATLNSAIRDLSNEIAKFAR